MRKHLFFFSLFLFPAFLNAAVTEFPGRPWTETKIVYKGDHVLVNGADGKNVMTFTPEPSGDYLKHLVVSQTVDALVIDARAAFKAGLLKLVFTSANVDPAPLRGKDCVQITEVGAVTGDARMLSYFEGHGENGRHYYASRKISVPRRPRPMAMVQSVPDWVKTIHLRWDILSPGRGPLVFRGARFARETELPVTPPVEKVKPELLFYAPFDGSPDASFARGSAQPLVTNGLTFAAGKRGKAVRLTASARSALAYAAKDNLAETRGTVSLWFKREWPDNGRDEKGNNIWRVLFANPVPVGRDRIGSGEIWFWNYGPTLRADLSDDDDRYRCWTPPDKLDDWCHFVVTWNETGPKLYFNGRPIRGEADGESPMIKALRLQDGLSFDRVVFDRFYVGCRDHREAFDGLIDELRIYSAPLDAKQIYELYRRESVIELTASGCYGVADKPGDVTVSAVSPAGCDFSGLTYCLRGPDGAVVCAYKERVTKKPVRLLVNLPAGSYTLCATDGTYFYGKVPYVVFPAGNPYESHVNTPASVPGCPPDLECVETLKLDRLPAPDRFRAVGATAFKQLNGVPYLEAAAAAGSRYALRFHLDTNAPLYCFEIDYPDDAVRTTDLIIQKSGSADGDYTMQVGFATGDEYPNTGRILTHRCLYWTGSGDVTLIVMTARDQAPAAVSAVRVYRVKSGALPAAVLHEPKARPPDPGLVRLWRDLRAGEATLPKAAQGRDWNRSFALYFEDPAIGYDFAVSKSDGSSPDDLNTLINRTAALMKYTGENVLAYPGAWYHGLINDVYNPRRHASKFLSAWYTKFDDEGLFIMPTLNVNTMPVPEDLVTRQTMINGSLHQSVISIHDTGKPNWGGWHNTPPNFNISHPDVRKYIENIVDALLDQGADHASFRGICLHLTRHCLLWFGDEEAGYNDYTVDAFAKATGLKIPVDRNDPLRGKAYADWIRAHAKDAWIQWRCDLVTAFYTKLARKLSARRPDLKLWVNSFVPANVRHPDFLRPDFLERANRAAGLDRARLTEIPNVILCQSLVPADYRWRHASSYPSPETRAHQRIVDEQPGFYALLKDARYPWVNQHDRYWESPIGRGVRGANTLSCEWLKECAWRVSTINPSGFHALRHFVLPFRYSDVLGLSKGGFLIGTYGMEDKLVPFIRAFRSLPAVVFDDVPSPAGMPDDFVRIRRKEYEGESYFYIVNTDNKPVTVKVSVPARTHDLVTGTRLGGILSETTLPLHLSPYEMRAFKAPSGRPVRLSE